jgi:Cu/Ag efflux protein CusF
MSMNILKAPVVAYIKVNLTKETEESQEKPRCFVKGQLPVKDIIPQSKRIHIRFEVLTAMKMHIMVFSVVTPFRRNVSPPSSG